MDERPKSKRTKTIAYFTGLAALVAFIVFAILNDITVANWQGKMAGMLGQNASTISAKPYDLTAVSGAQVCAQNATGLEGRSVASVETRVGIRPKPGETDIRITDTFICVFDTGETLPFMVTYVGGQIVDIR